VPESPMFKTSQKDELKFELERLRAEAVAEIQGSFNKAVVMAEKEKKNALKIFIDELNKKIKIFGQMAYNYL
jgi:hypothetical protein